MTFEQITLELSKINPKWKDGIPDINDYDTCRFFRLCEEWVRKAKEERREDLIQGNSLLAPNLIYEN